jgi:hypothetical protein
MDENFTVSSAAAAVSARADTAAVIKVRNIILSVLNLDIIRA